ncbi:MAG: sugar phosphate nucleotidyltransferase, partial [Syntrophomonas sp.]
YDRVVIITNDSLLAGIEQLVAQRADAGAIEILSEPEGKNTAPAVGLVLSRYFKEDNDQILGVFPADHHVLNTDSFISSIQQANRAAELDRLATIGVSPHRPETGYGYIEKTKWEIGEIPGVFEVGSFCEKPDVNTAQTYLEGGQHMWNAGIYIGKGRVLMEEFEKYLPDVFYLISKGYDAYLDSYPELPNISLDYGIAEKSDRMVVVPADFGWCDLGSWNALAEIHTCDQDMNICNGPDIVAVDSKGCIVQQSEKSVVLFGVENLLLVETEDIIFVSDRKNAQDIRTLIDQLNLKERYDLL